MSKLVFLSFADSRMVDALQRIGREANNMKVFDDIILMSEKELDASFWDQFGAYCMSNKRGFGYWIWKSHIIRQTLEKLSEGDFLVYCDAGCVLNPRGIGKLEQYLVKAKMSKMGLTAFSTGLLERCWCKGDVLDFFQYYNEREITESPQYMSGIIVICKNKINIDFVREWERISQVRPDLVDDSPSQIPNHAGFSENRHDQSIYSLLIKKYGGFAAIADHEVDVWPDEPWRWHRLKNNPILAKRNKTGISTLEAPVYKRAWWDILILCADIKNVIIKYAHSR